MLFAPTAGPVGIQPHGHTARMVNKTAAALALGDVVVTSFTHTNAVYPPTTVAQQNLSPFACVIKADGNSATPGYIGVVTELGSENGAAGSEVLVQFGGVASAFVTATTAAVAFGDAVGISDGAGAFGNAAAATSTYPAAIALGTVAIGATTKINVLMAHDIWYYADI
jgi:hypothetical protein